MEHPAPHSMMIEARRVAVYIDEKNSWFPARDYQEESIKDFISTLDTSLYSYKKLLDDGILIPDEISKRYEPKDLVVFTISYNVLNKDNIYYINTIGEDGPMSHLATIYHTWNTVETIKKHPIISKIGNLSNELIANINSFNTH